MGGKTAVGVHHQLPAGQPGVGGGTALHKPAGGVDENLHILGEVEAVQNGIQHFRDDLPAKLLQILVRIVLDGYHNVLGAHGFSVLIGHGHLGLAIGADATDGSIVHGIIQPFADFIRKDHRDGQTGPGFPGGVTVHGAWSPAPVEANTSSLPLFRTSRAESTPPAISALCRWT